MCAIHIRYSVMMGWPCLQKMPDPLHRSSKVVKNSQASARMFDSSETCTTRSNVANTEINRPSFGDRFLPLVYSFLATSEIVYYWLCMGHMVHCERSLQKFVHQFSHPASILSSNAFSYILRVIATHQHHEHQHVGVSPAFIVHAIWKAHNDVWNIQLENAS